MTRKTILLVDDDTSHRTMLKANLEAAGYGVVEADDGDRVLPALAGAEVDLILLDLKMKRVDGLEVLELLRREGVYLPVVVLTAFSSVDSAVAAMKAGAFDYVTKPVDIDELKILLERALDFERLQTENELLKKRVGEHFDFGHIIGRSPAMEELFATLALVAPSDANVLILGESGTGKELVANVLHQNSARRQGPFVAVNCAALQENLLESELFGHEKGAFTGADARRRGRFEQAHGGTLFLDEIGDMALGTQAKILRVLQEGTFERVGGDTTIHADVRILAATHKDLERLVAEGGFRQDLYYRLNVVQVDLPPLRERKEDIPLLAEHFLKRSTAANRKVIQGFHPSTMARLVAHDWPGNTRELQNCVERAVILCPGETIMPADLPPQLARLEPEGGSAAVSPGATLRDMERELIRVTLEQNGGNRSRTAAQLGIARQTLLNKMKEYGIG